MIFLLSIPATLKLYVLPDDSPDSTNVVPLVLVVISSVVSLRALMMYPVRQIECCDGGDQVILTELSVSTTTDNPIGEPNTV